MAVYLYNKSTLLTSYLDTEILSPLRLSPSTEYVSKCMPFAYASLFINSYLFLTLNDYWMSTLRRNSAHWKEIVFSMRCLYSIHKLRLKRRIQAGIVRTFNIQRKSQCTLQNWYNTVYIIITENEFVYISSIWLQLSRQPPHPQPPPPPQLPPIPQPSPPPPPPRKRLAYWRY